MKYYILSFLLLLSFGLKAQITYTPMIASGYQMKYLKPDSGFALPLRDTAIGRGVNRPGLMVINSTDSLLYYYSGKKWKPVYVDSAGVIKIANGKVDSISISGNNIFYWVGGVGYGKTINKVDSLTDSGDSISYWIGGSKSLILQSYTKSKTDSIKPQYLADIPALQAYTGTATTVIVQDSLRGGIFSYVASATPDSGTVFAKSGGGYWKRQFSGLINVQWFGAYADSLTICNTPIKNAATYASTLIAQNKTATLWFPEGKPYIVTDSVNIPAGVSLRMDGTLYFRKAFSAPALVIGNYTTYSQYCTYKIRVQSEATSDWLDSTYIGVKMYNIYASTVNIEKTQGFTIGVKVIGSSGKSCVYNNFSNIISLDNHIGLELFSKDAGWTNNNSFYSAKFSRSTPLHTGSSVYGVVLSSNDNELANNNNFYGFDFELSGSESAPKECVPIDIVFGSDNGFYGVRDEGNNDGVNNVFFRTNNNSSNNYLEVGYGNGNVSDVGSYPSTIKRVRTGLASNGNFFLQYSSGELSNRVTPYNSGNWYAPDELFFGGSGSGATILPEADTSAIKKVNNALYLASNGGIGVRVVTDTYKRFNISRDVLSGFGGRIAVRCYDSLGNVLASGTTSYVKGDNGNALSYFSTFGGVYETGSDASSNTFFQVLDTVKYVDVLFCGGTNPIEIRSFKIQALDGNTTVRNLKTGRGSYATQAPTFGTFDAGTVIWNASAASSNSGWICTVAGTPGTWSPFGFTKGYTDGNFVHKTGTDTIAGVKTFTNNIAANPTSQARARIDLGTATSTNYLLGVLGSPVSPQNLFELAVRSGVGTAANTELMKLGLDYNGTLNAGVSFYRGGSSVGGWLAWYTNDGTEKSQLDASGNYILEAVNAKFKYTYNPTMTAGDSLGVYDKKAVDSIVKGKADTGTVKFITTGGIKSDTTSNPGYITFSLDQAFVNYKITTTSAASLNLTADSTSIKELIVANSATNAVAVYLPAISTVKVGKEYILKRLGTNTVSINEGPGDSNVLDGAFAAINLTIDKDAIVVVNDGTAWIVTDQLRY